MSEGETTNSSNSATEPYKQEQFKAFIKSLSKGSISHWVVIAEALHVDRDTINAWRKLPEAQEAIQNGIAKCLDEMEKSGGQDWRMWNERLKTLGVIATEKHDLTSGGEKIEFAVELTGGTDECKTSSETERSDEGQS